MVERKACDAAKISAGAGVTPLGESARVVGFPPRASSCESVEVGFLVNERSKEGNVIASRCVPSSISRPWWSRILLGRRLNPQTLVVQPVGFRPPTNPPPPAPPALAPSRPPHVAAPQRPA